MLVYKLFENFKVSWDPEILEQKFTSTKNVFSDGTTHPFWQYFNTKISFGRNLYINFKSECEEVIDNLIMYQKNIAPGQNNLLDIFLKSPLNPLRVTIMKILPSDDVKPHIDVTRNLALNIGLKNSNKWTTIVSNTTIISEFDNHMQEKYILNDGDGYLVNIKKVHKVLRNSYVDSPRYVISYNF